MIGRIVVRALMLLGVFAVAASAAQAEQVDCRFFKVSAESLNVYTEPHGDSSFLGALNRNDLVCVAGDQQVGDRKWAYIAYRMLGGEQRKTLDGWGIMTALQPASQDEVAAVRNAPPPRQESAAPPPQRPEIASPAPRQDIAPPPASGPPAAAAPRMGESSGSAPTPERGAAAEGGDADGEIVRFSQPLTFGGYPVQGFSLEELVKGVPEFAPIEGLPENVWRKTCNNCHQWNRESLCVQAKIYAQDEKMAFRKQHPYGGPEKVVMMRWARQGCQ